ncbi:MAG: transketolase [Bacilli bacterium]|jgi:transketolase
MNQNELKIVDTIRALGIDMIDMAGSGHPGIVLGAAPIIYTLFAKHLKVNPKVDKWVNRDRFVLSAGHGSALLYATLFLAGFDLTIDDLKAFRRVDSKTPGHPEYGVTSGVDMTTGPLGQGFASAVGMAMAERYLATKYNVKKKNIFDPNLSIFDYYTYVLCSDGDLMEGVTYEAASLAGTLGLGKLIVLYDSNDVSLDGTLDKTFTEDVLTRFSAMGWHTQLVKNGEDINAIDKAIAKAKDTPNKPSIIQIKTIIGKGSINEGKSVVHGHPLDKEDIEQLKNRLGIRNIPFAVSQDATDAFRKMINERIESNYNKWLEIFNSYMGQAVDAQKKEIDDIINHRYQLDINSLMWQFNEDLKEATRETNGKVMNVIADNLHNFMGGSADVASSTKTYLNKYPNYTKDSYDGRNIWFGVREHAMGAILNGISLSGIRTFGSTFLSFSDYMKPAIRLSCMMNLPVTYIFTHDSINIGPDGPTHQPIEQLAMLRSIPNLDVYRPADAKEVVGVWQAILNSNNPSALILSRADVNLQIGTDVMGVLRGAYIVKPEQKRLDGIIIATGSEVDLAIQVSNELFNRNIDIRVISMPCMSLFFKQSKKYQEDLFPIGVKKIVIEAGSSYGWHRFVYNEKYLITLDEFGKSAAKDDVLASFAFNFEAVVSRVEKILR